MDRSRRVIRREITAYADTDPEVYTWLASLDAHPLAHGEKARQMRAVLLAGLRAGSATSTPARVDVEHLANELLGRI